MATVQVNPDCLRWAREEASLSLAEAAEKAGISSTKRLSAATRLKMWESGSDLPTRQQALKLAKAYRRPLITFFLSAPPKAAPTLKDFRVHVAGKPLSADLAAVVRRLQAQQQEVRDLLLDDEDFVRPAFVGSVTPDQDTESIAAKLRSDLELTLADQRAADDSEALCKLIRSRAEKIGLFVLLVGDLGNYHTAIEADEYRGLALADDVAPFVAINPNDARGARTFTLVHELCHIWLGDREIGNSSPFSVESDQADIERKCNAVAETILLPESALLETWSKANSADVASAVDVIASEFNVSHTSVAYRLWRSGKIDDATWRQLSARYKKQWDDQKEKQRDAEGGPNYFVVRRNALGSGLLKVVLGAVADGDLSSVRASRILRVRPGHLSVLGQGLT